MAETTRFKYAGSTPGADSNTYPIFSTVTAFTGADALNQSGIKRIKVDIACNHDGTLKVYRSSDRGTNWIQVFGDITVTAPAAGLTDIRDFNVAGYPDVKIDWVNGGSAQTTWNINIAGVDEYAPAS